MRLKEENHKINPQHSRVHSAHTIRRRQRKDKPDQMLLKSLKTEGTNYFSYFILIFFFIVLSFNLILLMIVPSKINSVPKGIENRILLLI